MGFSLLHCRVLDHVMEVGFVWFHVLYVIASTTVVSLALVRDRVSFQYMTRDSTVIVAPVCASELPFDNFHVPLFIDPLGCGGVAPCEE